jgi:hypothetical protein
MNATTNKTSAPVINKLAAPAKSREKKANLLDAIVGFKGLGEFLPTFGTQVDHLAARSAIGAGLSEAIGRNAGTLGLTNPGYLRAGQVAAGLASGGTVGGLTAALSPVLTRRLTGKQVAGRLGAASGAGILGEFGLDSAIAAAQKIPGQNELLERADAATNVLRKGLIGDYVRYGDNVFDVSMPSRMFSGALAGDVTSEAFRRLPSTRGAFAKKLAPETADLYVKSTITGVAPSYYEMQRTVTKYRMAGIKVPDMPAGLYSPSGAVADAAGIADYLKELVNIASRESNRLEANATGLGLAASMVTGGLEGMGGALASRLAAGDMSASFADRLKNLTAAGALGLGSEAIVKGISSGDLLLPVAGSAGATLGTSYLTPKILNRLSPEVAKRYRGGLPKGSLPAAMGATAMFAGAPVLGATGILAAPFVNPRSSAYIRDGINYLKERRNVSDLTKGSSFGRSSLEAPVVKTGSMDKSAFKFLGKFFGAGRGTAQRLGKARGLRAAVENIGADGGTLGQNVVHEFSAKPNFSRFNPFERFRRGQEFAGLRDQHMESAVAQFKQTNPGVNPTASDLNRMRAEATQYAETETAALEQYAQPGADRRYQQLVEEKYTVPQSGTQTPDQRRLEAVYTRQARNPRINTRGYNANTANPQLLNPTLQNTNTLSEAEVVGRGLEGYKGPTYGSVADYEAAVLSGEQTPIVAGGLRDRLYSLFSREGATAAAGTAAAGAGAFGILAGAAKGTALAASGLGLVAGIPLAGAALYRLAKNKTVTAAGIDLLRLRGVPEGTGAMFEGANLGTLRKLFRNAGIDGRLESTINTAATSAVVNANVTGEAASRAVSDAVRNAILRGDVSEAGIVTALQASGFEAAEAATLARTINTNSQAALGQASSKVTAAYEKATAQMGREFAIKAEQGAANFDKMVADTGFAFSKGELAKRAKGMGETEESLMNVAGKLQQVINTLGRNSPRSQNLIKAFESATKGEAASPQLFADLRTQLDRFISGQGADIRLPGGKNLVLTPTVETAGKLEGSAAFNITKPQQKLLSSSFSTNAINAAGTQENLVLTQAFSGNPGALDSIRNISASNPALADKLLNGTIRSVDDLTLRELSELDPNIISSIDGVVNNLNGAGNQVAADLVRNSLSGRVNLSTRLTEQTEQLAKLRSRNDQLVAKRAATGLNQKEVAELNLVSREGRALETNLNQTQLAYNELRTITSSSNVQSNIIEPARAARINAQQNIIANTSRVELAAQKGTGAIRADFSADDLAQLKQYASRADRNTVISAAAQQYGITPQVAEDVLIRNGILEPAAGSMLQAPVQQAAGGAMQYVAPVGVAGAGGGAIYYGSQPGRSQYYNPQQQQQPPGMYPRASFGANALSAPVIGMHKVSSTRFNPLSAPVARR